MGLFDFFKKPLVIENNYFGKLTFMEIKKNPNNNYFEGAGMFEPTNQEIEYFITADISGPTKEQEQFYETVKIEYHKISEKCSNLIEKEFQNWNEDFKIKDFNSEFTLVAISIPRQDQNPLEWDLAYETSHDENHQFTVYFRDFEPEYVGIDG